MAVWPPTIPNLQLAGLKRRAEPNTITSVVDNGPTKSRRRSTKTRITYQIPYQCQGGDRDIFQEFFDTKLENGTLPFEWDDPTSDARVSMRFVREPEWTLSVGAKLAADRWYDCMLELEIL